MIRDEIGPGISGTVTWALHTAAEPVSVAGSVARFRSGEDRFVVRILDPGAARFDLVFPPEPRSFPIADVRQLHGRFVLAGSGALVSELPRCADEEGKRAAGALIRRLQIVWPRGTRKLSVLLLPDCDDHGFALPVTPLSQWLTGHPVRRAHSPGPRYWTEAAQALANRAVAGLPRLRPGLLQENRPARMDHA